MKAKVLSVKNEPVREVDLPSWFSEKIREDISQKYFEISKRIQPHTTDILAGMRYSASGKLRHMRHKWKTTYGHGISRVPRKILWRRGDQFYWIGATISSTRGGRRAHPPKIEHFLKEKKMNKKEIGIALKSGLIATTKEDLIRKRYENLRKEKLDLKFPILISSDFLKLKTKDFYAALKSILKGNLNNLLQKKEKKSGKGKIRRGKNKKTAGLLLVIGNEESIKIKGIDCKKVKEIEMRDLWPLGRFTIFTEKAISELKDIGSKYV